MDRWNDSDFAIQWDQTSLQGNPTRVEQLDILISLIADIYRQGSTLLDLGIGSGLVEEQLFARVAGVEVVGVDASPAMLDLAKQRLAAFEDRCTLIQHDFAGITELALPAKPYQIVMSVQALHHLPHQEQRAVVRSVADLLPSGGVFLLMDRVALDADHFAALYRAMWRRLERVSKVKSGWSEDYFLERLTQKGDHVASLEEQMTWLREAEFSAVTCLHLHLNRALVAAVK